MSMGRKRRQPNGICHRMNLSWQDYFGDPSVWCDNRNNKSTSTLPDFRHRATNESLWVDGWFNPCWVHEELRRRMAMFPTHHELKQNHEKDLTFVALLKDYAKKKDLCQGARLHGCILNTGLLEKNPYLVSALISMYAKCNAISKAHQLHQELQNRSIISWNALISGYVQQGQGHEAFKCYDDMQREGISPNAVTFTCILKACSNTRSIQKGRNIHDEIVNKGFLEGNIVLGTALVDMYAKCGVFNKAQQVFEELPIRDIISWSVLISGYAQNGLGYAALNCFELMKCEGLSPDEVTFACVLKACGSIGAIEDGKKIHDDIVDKGLLGKNVVLGTALVGMYAKCGMLMKARQLHDELSERSIVSWNALIAGYAEQDQCHESLECLGQMEKEGFYPDAITFVCILKVCGKIGAIAKGEQIHDEIMSRGLLTENIMLGTALVDMYAKCSVLEKAKKVLEAIHVRDVISWNSLITGYAEQGCGHEALECLERMRCEGLSPDVVTFTCILKACGNVGFINKGQHMHSEVVYRGLAEVLATTLVDMYAKCGMIVKAQKLHSELHIRSLISWNALIAGYAQGGQAHEALNCFKLMCGEGFCPDAITYTCILTACGSAGAIDKGKEIHDVIIRGGLLRENIMLGTSLVDMYAKCNVLEKAQEVLQELPVRDVAAWNALIAGYAQRGRGHEALNCFTRMLDEGLSPDSVTLLCVLNSCSHSGLLDEAEMHFGNMKTKYGITPVLEHNTCMVVVLGSAGHFDKVMLLIKSMPPNHYPAVWLALLSTCRKWGNVKLGRLAFDQTIQLGCNSAAACVLMANIFADACMQEDAEKIGSFEAGE